MKEIIKVIIIIIGLCFFISIIAGFIDLMKNKKNSNRLYADFVKRIIDCFISALALIFLSPIFIVIAFLVRLKLGTPIIFSQERPGKNEKPFKMYKFRSMTSDTDEKGNLLPDNLRLTQFGKLLRNTSLDELPELINIFKGDMSIIGPRPLLMRYLPFYTDEEHHRHDLRPGLTGLAQVKGRNFITWEEIFAYDLKYVRECSFTQDVYVFFETIKKVLKHEDISDATQGVEDSSGRKVHDALDVERKNMSIN